MKIAFVGTLPAASLVPELAIRPGWGGIGHPAPWIQGLLPELARRGSHSMRVFLVDRALRRRVLVEHDGVEYEGVPCLLPQRLTRRSLYYAKSIPARRVIREFAPDLVHAFGLETGSATVALRSGYPVSAFIQGIAEYLFPFYGQRRWSDRQVGRLCERQAAARVRWFVAENEFARSWALRHRADAQVAVIPHPLRPAFLQHGPPDFRPSLVTIGGLDDRKGVDTIIRALVAMQRTDCGLVVIGGGRLRHSLQRLAGELGLSERVRFLGSQATEAVICELRKASGLVIASRMDTSPNVVTEAHGIGLPVIGTRAGGIPEMIDEGEDGFLVDVDDAESMAERMDRLLADPEAARRMGESGRRKVAELNDPSRIAELHLEFFNRIAFHLGKAT